MKETNNNNKCDIVVGDWIRYDNSIVGQVDKVIEGKDTIWLYYTNNSVAKATAGSWAWYDECISFAFKNGDEVEVSMDNEIWNNGIFIGINPINSRYRYVATCGSRFNSVSPYKYIRPVQPKPTTIDVKIGNTETKLSIESAKALQETLNKELGK